MIAGNCVLLPFKAFVMKKTLLLLTLSVALLSCGTRKKAADPDTLPKDVALRPDTNSGMQYDREQLSLMRKEIEAMIALTPCTNTADWMFAPIGAKPCGGPSSYIAYPIARQNEILPLIQKFSSQQAAFNQKYKMMSDCALVPEPAGIRCEDGKAILIGNRSVASPDVPQ